MDINFLHPVFLLLLLGIPALWFFPRRPATVTQAVLRSLLFACIVLALARPVLLTEAQAMFQVLVVDHSASINPQQREKANALTEAWLGQIKDRDKSSMIVIGGDPKAGNETQASGRVGAIIPVTPVASTGSTSSLSAALAAARQQIPEGSPAPSRWYRMVCPPTSAGVLRSRR